MFFYVPFFMFVAVMLLLFSELKFWLGYGYVIALILPRILRR